GPFTFFLDNTTFAGGHVGDGVICAGQHCGLDQTAQGTQSMCNVQYVLRGVKFEGIYGEQQARHIRFGISGGNPVLPIFTALDNSLGGYRSIVSGKLGGFAQLPGCVQLGKEYDYGIGCDTPMRRLSIWSRKDQGTLQLRGPGYDVNPVWASPTFGLNGGFLIKDKIWGHGGGYPAVVKAGATYALDVQDVGAITLAFSDSLLGSLLASPDNHAQPTATPTVAATEPAEPAAVAEPSLDSAVAVASCVARSVQLAQNSLLAPQQPLDSASVPWRTFEYAAGTQSISFAAAGGARITLPSAARAEWWHNQLLQNVQLDEPSGAYELCVRASATGAGSQVQISVDADAPTFAVAGGGARLQYSLAGGGAVMDACFYFALGAAAGGAPFSGRIVLDLGKVTGELSICQISLRAACDELDPPSPPPAPPPSPPPTVACTALSDDPWAQGHNVACCGQLRSCLGDWGGDGRWHYLCLAT
ncbi:hypothetical protein T492DRAFT_897359, partial [Pavlovales sp. CCMP2436]